MFKNINYLQAIQRLKLINPGINPFNQEDFSNVFMGYTPLIVKLIESVLTNGQDYLQLYPGKTDFQNFKDYQNILVFVTGGVTYGEVQLLRRLGAKLNKNIMVGSPQTMNSSSLAKLFLSN